MTPRTIRYYEELGLLGSVRSMEKGSHRTYAESDVARLQELIRLRDLLGLTLEELVELAEAEEARATLRDRWEEDPSDEERLRIVEAAIPHVERQLALVRSRQATLGEFAAELQLKLGRLRKRRRELSVGRGTDQRSHGSSSRSSSRQPRGATIVRRSFRPSTTQMVGTCSTRNLCARSGCRSIETRMKSNVSWFRRRCSTWAMKPSIRRHGPERGE